MNFSFHPEAQSELNNSIEYYESCQNGLGYDFALEVSLTIKRILLYPKAWPEIENGIRRSLLTRFPYGVLYHIQNESIIILAVMNLYREPGYWKERIK